MFCCLKQRERICFQSPSANGTFCRGFHGGDGADTAASPCPAPVGHLMGCKTFPSACQWLPPLFLLHPPSLLGTNQNQGWMLSNRSFQLGYHSCPERSSQSARHRAEGCPLPGLMLIQACANTLSHPSPIPCGLCLVPWMGEQSPGGTGHRLTASPASALSRPLTAFPTL